MRQHNLAAVSLPHRTAWQPRAKSTGLRSPEGRQRVSRDAWTGRHRAQLRDLVSRQSLKPAIVLALCLVFQVQAETLLGRVINVADGDTITVLDDTHTQHKIRLTGIDAPEKRQAFGNVSKQSLVEQVAGQSVAVEWVKVDKYGRKVGKVLLAGLDCNLVQVKRGLAWHYKQYQREQLPADQQSYAAAEIEARTAKLGLWRDADSMPPWEFRQQGR